MTPTLRRFLPGRHAGPDPDCYDPEPDEDDRPRCLWCGRPCSGDTREHFPPREGDAPICDGGGCRYPRL